MRRLPRSAAVIALAVAGFAAAAVVARAAVLPDVDSPASTTQQAGRVKPPNYALVIGDSAIAYVRWVPGASSAVIGFDRYLDLESCRRLVIESCTGRERRKPPTALEALTAAGNRARTLVIATGYNDGSEGFESWFRTIVGQARAQGIRRVVWYTLRSDVTYASPGAVGNHLVFAENNATLRRLVSSGDFPDVVLADWHRYTQGHPEWFTSDGVHYKTVTAWIAADYLSRKMAFLDGRRCPMPTSPGGVPQNPCPDPDGTGPIADVPALYPIGADGVLCYEIGPERDVVCR